MTTAPYDKTTVVRPNANGHTQEERDRIGHWLTIVSIFLVELARNTDIKREFSRFVGIVSSVHNTCWYYAQDKDFSEFEKAIAIIEQKLDSLYPEWKNLIDVYRIN
jgi:hypothetical protein